MTLCFSLLWQCHVCKFLSSFGLGRCFLPEATAFRDLIKPGCPFPHFPVPSPHLPLPHQASPAIRGRMPGGHKDQVRVVMGSACFGYFSLKAKLRQDAQGGPPEVVIRDQVDGEIMPSVPALPAAPGQPQAGAVMPPSWGNALCLLAQVTVFSCRQHLCLGKDLEFSASPAILWLRLWSALATLWNRMLVFRNLLSLWSVTLFLECNYSRNAQIENL